MNKYRAVLAGTRARRGIPLMGLRTMAAYVRDRAPGGGDCDVRIVEDDFSAPLSIDQYVEKIVSLDPDLVGLSCYVWNFSAMKKVAKALRVRNRSVPLVIGGPCAWGVEETETEKWFDVAVQGEGEAAFSEIVGAHLQGALCCEKIRGVVFWDGNRYRKTEQRLLSGSLDDIPSVYLTGGIDLSEYDRLTYIVEMARGCPIGCAYCSWSRQKPRYFSTHRILSEIEYILAKKGKGYFYLSAADPYMSPEYLIEFLGEFKKLSSGRDVLIRMIGNPENISSELLPHLNVRNMELSLGIQAVDPEIHRAVGRSFHLRRVEDTLGRLGREAPSLRIQTHFMFGLPGDSPGKHANMMDWALSHPVGKMIVHQTGLYPGTLLWNRRDHYSYRYTEDGANSFSSSSTYSSREVEQTVDMQRYFKFVQMTPGALKILKDMGTAAGPQRSWSVCEEFIGRLRKEKEWDGSDGFLTDYNELADYGNEYSIPLRKRLSLFRTLAGFLKETTPPGSRVVEPGLRQIRAEMRKYVMRDFMAVLLKKVYPSVPEVGVEYLLLGENVVSAVGELRLGGYGVDGVSLTDNYFDEAYLLMLSSVWGNVRITPLDELIRQPLGKKYGAIVAAGLLDRLSGGGVFDNVLDWGMDVLPADGVVVWMDWAGGLRGGDWEAVDTGMKQRGARRIETIDVDVRSMMSPEVGSCYDGDSMVSVRVWGRP